MKLYLGVGPHPIHEQHYKYMECKDINQILKEWTLVDKYVKQLHTVNWDAEKLDEVPDESCEAIYSSHLLEHFSHRRVKDILTVWYRKLKPGGKLITNVPDLEWVCRNFLQMLKVERSGNTVPIEHEYYNRTCDYSDNVHSYLQIFYGSHENDGEYHKSGYTKDSLIKLLTDIGFTILSVEQEVEAHAFGCLIVIAQK